MNRRLYVTSILFLLLSFLNSFVSAHTIKGKLERFGDYGVFPAPFINVTLENVEGRRLKNDLTGSDGLYTFANIDEGKYYLLIWAKGLYDKPIRKEIEVLDSPVTEIKPILIHRFEFESPEEGKRYPIGSTDVRIKTRGIHYSMPEEAKVWIVLKCKNDNFLLATDKNVHLKDDGTWESREILMDRPISSILAVMVTNIGHNFFNRMAHEKKREEFPQLLRYSFVISTRNIYFR